MLMIVRIWKNWDSKQVHVNPLAILATDPKHAAREKGEIEPWI
jgi:hypothetical protein